MFSGSCHCGAVRFGGQLSLTDVYICHCSLCRKATGSGGIAVTIVSNDHFSWSSGKDQIRTWSKPKHDWQSNFCCQCGSPVPGKNDDESHYIPVGSLDSGYEELVVVHHLFVSSKAPWEVVCDDGVQHQGNFEAAE